MPVFYVSTITKEPNGQGGLSIQPVPYTDVLVKWKSGGGSPLPDTKGRTDGSGVATMVTPENYLQLGLPTGAEGIITASNGTARGQSAILVDFWGQPIPKRQAVVMTRDTEGAVKDTANKVVSGLTKSAWLVIGLALAGAALTWGVVALLKR